MGSVRSFIDSFNSLNVLDHWFSNSSTSPPNRALYVLGFTKYPNDSRVPAVIADTPLTKLFPANPKRDCCLAK